VAMMGYTHYWFVLNENYVNNVLPTVINEYKKYIDYFKDIADININGNNISISSRNDEGETFTLHDVDNLEVYVAKYDLPRIIIRARRLKLYNTDDDKKVKTFIRKNFRKTKAKFGFVKTNLGDYDIAVTTFLALLKFYARDAIIIETDGDDDTWYDTFKLLRGKYCEFTIRHVNALIYLFDYLHLRDLVNAPILSPYEGLICSKQHVQYF
jgi:hypothetical protein